MEGFAEIALLIQLIAMRPITANVEAVNRVVMKMHNELMSAGLNCAIEELNGRQILFASTDGSKTPDILLCCHLDVVPADYETQYDAEIKDGVLYGRGAVDCLGNAVVCAHILKACAQKADCRHSVGCIFATDEEIGGHTTQAMVDRGYGARQMVVLLDAGDGIFYAQKGVLSVKLTAVGRGGHSSAPWLFDNPIDKLLEAYAKLKSDWENPACEEDWRMSMTATMLSAGNAHNRIPDTASIVLNFRTVAAGENARLLDWIKSTTGLDIEIINDSSAFYTSTDSQELEQLKQSYQKHFGEEVELQRIVAATDAHHFASLNLPIAISGVKGAGEHSACETLELDSLNKMSDTILDLVL